MLTDGKSPMRLHPEHLLRRAARRVGVRRAIATYRHFGLTQDDAFIGSYPKSGNTWVRFVVADLATDKDVTFLDVEETIPSVGSHAKAPPILPTGGRIIKTHEPCRSVHGRTVIVVRDPRDVVLSYRRFLTRFGHDLVDLDDFVDAFSRGRVGSYGAWNDHTAGWIEARDSGLPVLLVTYENLKRSPTDEFDAISKFMGFEVTRDRVAQASIRNSAVRMREKEAGDRTHFSNRGWNNESTSFVGRATVGGWKEELTEHHLALLKPHIDLYNSLVEFQA